MIIEQYGQQMEPQISSIAGAPDVATLLRSASRYLEQGALDQAEVLFHQINRVSGRQYRAKALNGLGSVAMARGRFGFAISQFRQSLEAAPDDIEIRRNLLRAQIHEGQRLIVQEGRLDKAAVQLQAALDTMTRPQGGMNDEEGRNLLGSAFCCLGVQYKRQGDFQRSVDALRKAWALLPGNKYVWPALDEALMCSGAPAVLSDYTDTITKSEIGNHILIACFPKSGSTFLKNLLVEISGFPEQNLTFSHGKNDTGIYLPDLLECAASNTVTQLHVRASDSNINLIQGFSIRPIILVRNIFDVLLSYKEFHDQHARWISFYDQYEALEEAQRLDLIVDDRAAWYLGFFAGWQRAVRSARVDGLFVTYEDLMQNKVAKIEEIMRFYGLDRPRQAIADAIDKVSGNKSANRFNKGVAGRGRSRFNDRHREQINRIAGYHPDIDFSLIGL